MAESPSWTDWVTAISTAFTGLVTAVAAGIAMVTFRRERRREEPHVEIDVLRKTNQALGAYFLITLKVKNRSRETLIFNRCTIEHPKNVKLSLGKHAAYAGQFDAELGPTNSVDLNYSISAEGSPSYLPERGDVSSVSLYAFRAGGWREGHIRLRLDLSSKSAEIRDTRIIIKRRISAMHSSNMEVATSKTG